MQEKEFSYINVIPLVDIMLVLLTIALTTATFIVQGQIPVNLIPAKSGNEEKAYNAVSITIDRNGNLFINTRRVSPTQLYEVLKGFERDTEVNIRSDREARVQSLVSVMDVLQRLGFRDVNLIVKKGEI